MPFDYTCTNCGQKVRCFPIAGQPPNMCCPLCGAYNGQTSSGTISYGITTSNPTPPNNVANQPQQLGGESVVPVRRCLSRESIKELLYDIGFRGMTEKQSIKMNEWCERYGVA